MKFLIFIHFYIYLSIFFILLFILLQAVLDRIDEQFEFPLPGLKEREEMLKQFISKYIKREKEEYTNNAAEGGFFNLFRINILKNNQNKGLNKKIEIDKEIDEEFIKDMAEKTEGFSGRQLAKVNKYYLFIDLLIKSEYFHLISSS